jgi:spore maturation protein CgeB
MIENETQLEQTRRAIAELEDALQSLKTRVFPENPALFEAMASDYVTTLSKLRADVSAYIVTRNQSETL